MYQNTYPELGSGTMGRPTNDNDSLNKGKRETNHVIEHLTLSAHERGQLGPVDYLAGPGDVWESRLKAEG